MVFFLAGTDATPTGFTGEHGRPVHTDGEPTMPLPSGGLSGTSGGDGGEFESAEKEEEHKARISPSQRTRLFLLESKRKQQEEEDAGLRPKRAARTVKSPPNPVDSAATQHEQNHKQDKHDVVAELFPEKPKDWGVQQAVTADQQEPPKPRGRKPKASKVEAKGDANKVEAEGDSSNKKKRRTKQAPLESTASAEAAATTAPKTKKRRKIAEQPAEYQPMEVDGNINMDKGAAFDAYAAAASAADIAKLKRQDMVNEDANTTAATVAGTNRRKRGKQSEQKDNEQSGTKKGNEQAKSKQDKKQQKEDEKKATGDTDSKVPKVKTAEAKARYSRKSCAYKKALKEAQDKGASIEEAKAAAKEVPYN